MLYAEPLRITNWPEGSLEAALLSLSSQQKSNGERNNISGIIYTLLKEDSPDPGEKVISFVKYGLAARGLLETETKTTLKIFMSTKFILPDSTRLLVEKSPIEAIQALLDDCERQQPRGWEMLNDEIKKGLAERQEKPDTDIDD